jgi:hypothetical protein
VVIPLKILLELKKTTLLQQQKLSKAPRFVLGLLFCLNKPAPKRKCKTLMVLRHYTSGKPCLSSAFSSASDPKPCQLHTITTVAE